MNSRKSFELAKIRHKLCVEPTEPEKYLKNCLSKQAMQFVADYNIESGIRQIGKFGIVLEISKKDEINTWENQIRFDNAQPYLNSAFRITKKTTLFYKFGSNLFQDTSLIFDSLTLKTGQPVTIRQNYWTRIFPFATIDFAFKNEDWIERIRFANEVENILIPLFSACPKLLEMATKELKTVLAKLKEEKLNEEYFHKIMEVSSYNNKKKTKNMIRLSELVSKVHVQLIIARSYECLLDCDYFATQRITMFKSSFEYLLFIKFIFDNPDVMYTGDKHEVSFEPMLELEIPERFVNQNYKINSDRPKKKFTGKNKLQCPYCGRITDTPQRITKHIESRQGAKIHFCSVCKTVFSSYRLLQQHENTINHRLLSLGQYVPPHPRMENDKLISQFKCPHHDDNDQKYFILKENCVEHIKTHKSKTFVDPIDRLEGKDCSDLGVFTCNYCKFKTDSREFAEFHIKAVHFNHLDTPENAIKNNYRWEHDLKRHCSIDFSKEPFSNGRFKCLLCNATFSTNQNTIQHLLGSAHRYDFEQAAKGEKIDGIEQNFATKMNLLFKKYDTCVSKGVRTNCDKIEFLNHLVKHDKTINGNNYFWQIPDGKGGLKSDPNCYVRPADCWYYITNFNRNKLLKEFLNDENLSKQIKSDYSTHFYLTSNNQEIIKLRETQKNRKLIASLDFKRAEKKFVANHTDFRNFVTNKNFIITDARKLKENEQNKIPKKCKN